VNADGTITVDNPTTTGKVNYTPNDAKANVMIPSNQGDQTVPNVTGKTGEHVTVDVPLLKGYTADKPTVPATVNADGTITVDNPTTTGKVTYTPNAVTTDETVAGNENGQAVPDPTDSSNKDDQTVPDTTDSSNESGQAVTDGTDKTNKKTVASVSQQNNNINNKQTVIVETKSDSTAQATQAVTHGTAEHSILGVANKKAVVGQQTVIDNNSQHLNKAQVKGQAMGTSNKLPQTDESQSNSIFAKIGLELMGILALVGFAKKKRKHD